MNPLLIIGTVIWLYVLTVLKRTQLMAYFFIIGSVGLFFILITLSNPYWVWFFTHMVIQGVKGFGLLTGMCTVMSKYGAVHIVSGDLSSLLMTIDYECSGIIETSAFAALVLFFPAYSKKERLFYVVLGTLWIYLANVIRLIIVVIIVHYFGYSAFFLAHTIIGRLVFYGLVIALYYNIFTYSQLSQGLYNRFKSTFLTRKGSAAHD